MSKVRFTYLLMLLFTVAFVTVQAEEGNDHDGHNHSEEQHHSDEAHSNDHADDTHHDEAHGDDHGHHSLECHETKYDAGKVAIHHIADANVFSIGPWSIPLPCIALVKGDGLKVFSSGKFDVGHHGTGHQIVDGFAMYHHKLMYISDPSFPAGKVKPSCYGHHTKMVKDKEKDVYTVKYDGKEYIMEGRSTLDGGMFGGGMTSWYDFSLTKNVVTMLICFALLAWMFISIANSYKRREGQAPKGLQSFMEPIFLFIQDEVAKPIIGAKWQKYQPFLMALFFFILILNLFGQIPFFGNSNVTGNVSVTMALALFTMLVVNISGNRDYWQHIVWMPGVPAFVKLILTPVELLGVILKPMTLFIRLFGNIAAGHMVIIIFVSLIFIFGKAGESLAGGVAGISLAIPLTMFMMALELLVAALQAFVFTILTAVYIGAAIEEHHH